MQINSPILQVVSCLMVSVLFKMTRTIQDRVMFLSHEALNKSLSSIHSTANLLSPLNPSTIKLARSLTSLLNGTELGFTTIQTTVSIKLRVYICMDS